LIKLFNVVWKQNHLFTTAAVGTGVFPTGEEGSKEIADSSFTCRNSAERQEVAASTKSTLNI
jgi:hypothetical protein